MPTEKPTYASNWLILGGIGFGLYYTLCLGYFGAMNFDSIFHMQSRVRLGDYVPAAVILSLISIGLAFVLYGKNSKVGQAKRPWLRKLGILFLGHVVMLLALALCGIVQSEKASVKEIFGQLLIFLPLIGILPTQFVMMAVPSRRPSVPVAEVQAPVVDEPPTPDPAKTETAPAMLLIEASQGEPQFKVPLADLIAVEAADNYCKFHYLKDGQPKMKMLRLKMKEAEEALNNAPGYYRCHRSFLVNGAMVEEILGNSQAYRLKLRHLEEPIPVSRAFDVEPLRKSES